MVKHPHPIELAKSIRRFGLIHGVANCVRAAAPLCKETHMWVGDGTSLAMRRRTTDWETFSEVFLDECYRDDFVELFEPKPPAESVRTVVDAGANVGYATAYFRQRYPNASVWSLEPDPENFRQLVRNTRSDVKIHPILGALWSSHELVAVSSDSGAANGVRVSVAKNAADSVVQAYTMADVLTLVPAKRIDVLKLDVEGAERFIFDASADDRWLEHVGLILIELHDWKEPGSTRAYHDALHAFDYAEFALGGTVGTIIRGRRDAGK